MSQRDTIQAYIDLWASVDAESESQYPSEPPPPPPKDAWYRASSHPQAPRPQWKKDEELVVIGLKVESPVPTILQQIQTVFGKTPPQLQLDSIDMPSSANSDFYDYNSSTASTSPYYSIVNSNPFVSPISEYSDNSPTSKTSPRSSAKLLFSPPTGTEGGPRSTATRHSQGIPSPLLSPSLFPIPPQPTRNPPTPPPQTTDFSEFKPFENPRTLPRSPSRRVTPNVVPPSFPYSHSCPDGPVLSTKAAKMLGIDLPETPAFPASTKQPAHKRSSTAGERDVTLLPPLSDPYYPPSSILSSSHSRTTSLQTWSTSHASMASTIASSIVPPAYDPALDATYVNKALKRSKKPDTDLVSSILVSISREPYKLPMLREKYREMYSEDLEADIKSHISGPVYRLALCRLLAGPFESEAQWLNMNKNDNNTSFFMDEKMVTEILFGKSAEELEEIKRGFEKYENGVTLEKAFEKLYLSNNQLDTPGGGGSSGAFGKASIRILRSAGSREDETLESLGMMNGDKLLEREASLIKDVEALYRSERRRSYSGSSNGAGNVCGGVKYLDRELLLELVMRKSELYLGQLCRRFHERHKKNLAELVGVKDKSLLVRNFPTNLVYALQHVLNGTIDKPQRDAKLLEAAMKGLGRRTQDSRLIARVLRIHFDSNPRHLRLVKDAYEEKYGRELIERVRKDTKGPYRDLLVMLLEGNSGFFGITKESSFFD